MNSNKPAIKSIFKFGIEPKENCFLKYNKDQSLGSRSRLEDIGETMYMFIPESYKYHKSDEISIVTEFEKNQILKGAELIETYCMKSGRSFPTFEDKLKYAASLLPRSFYEGTKFNKWKINSKRVELWRKGGFILSFDEYARTWDNDLRINRAKVVAEEISKVIDGKRALTALEFGCGTGLVSFNLYDSFKHITLVDSSKGMIEILNSKIDNYKVNNMVTYHLDITAGDSLKGKYDVIYNSMVLHHIKDTEAIIKSFYDLLNDNGYLCIVDLDEEDGSFHKNYPDFDGYNGFNQDCLKNVLIKSGFDEVDGNTFYHNEKVIEGEKIGYSLFLIKGRKRFWFSEHEKANRIIWNGRETNL